MSDEELTKISEQEAKTEVIVVTGSNIERKSLTTTAPLQVLTRAELDAAGRTTLGDILQKQPAQSGGTNAQVNNGGDGSTRIDLRGLGPNRTLVLLNGRRMVSSGTGADASVDINTIPMAMVERVEILKDGASAVYGSDAIGGVVNIITRNDFNGSEANLYTATTQHGDGTTYDANFVVGRALPDGKGNILFSAGFQRQDSVFAGDRDFARYDRSYNYKDGTVNIGGSTIGDTGRINAFNIDTNGDGKGDRLNLCGEGVQYCTSDGKGGYRAFDGIKDLYNYQPANYLLTPSQRYNIFTSGDYKLGSSVKAFFESSFLQTTSSQRLAPEPFTTTSADIPISKDSIYNPTGYDLLGYERRLEEFGPRVSAQNNDTFQFVGGLQGTLPSDLPVIHDWKWEVSYLYGRSNSTVTSTGSLIVSRLAEAIGPSFYDGSGAAHCGTIAAPIDGCVPMNILGPAGSIDPKALGYVGFTGVASGVDEQQSINANAHGRLVELPNHGDISVAVGGDYRYEYGENTPDPVTAAGQSTGNATQATKGSYNVLEGFGELSVVPYTGEGALQWVELNLAARGFRYDTFGTGMTWKAGALIRTVEGIALRGTYSTSFRAPSIGQLYAGQATGFVSVEDPCDTRPQSAGGETITLDATTAAQCKAAHVPADASFGTIQQRATSGGNPDLQPEKAKTLTAGVVFEPPQVRGLAFTADYWNIDLQKSIGTPQIGTIFAKCYEQQIDSYCQLIKRNPNQGYAIDRIEATLGNLGELKTSGLDLAAAYQHKVEGIGTLHVALDATYLFTYNLDDGGSIVHARATYDLGTALPTWRGNLTGLWDHPSGWSGGFNARYVGSLHECDQDDCNDGLPRRNVDAWTQVDLFAGYRLKTPAGTTAITVGVNNVADAKPAVLYFGGQGDTDGTTYDLIGRQFYLRLQQSF